MCRKTMEWKMIIKDMDMNRMIISSSGVMPETGSRTKAKINLGRGGV